MSNENEGVKETAEKEFLESISNVNTRKEYRHGLQKFSAWFGKTPDQILKMRQEDLKSEDRFQRKRFERELEKFHAHLKEQGFGTNTCRTVCLGLRQFFRYYEVPILVRRGSEVGKSIVTEKTYPLTIEDLRKMFAVADLRQRVILSMAKDLALRIKDFLNIKKADLPDLQTEPPVAFDVMTEKEEVLAKGHLSAETVEMLKLYLPTVKDKANPYLFGTNGHGPMDEDTLGWNLKQLAQKAGLVIPKGKRLTFHAFRKLFISTGKNLNVDPDMIRKMCGKSVESDTYTYMTGVQWREAFGKIADILKIQALSNHNHTRLEELEEKITKLNRLVTDQSLTLDAYKQDLADIRKEVDAVAEQSPEPLRTMLRKTIRKLRATSRKRKIPKSELEKIKREEQPTKEEA